MNKFICIFFIIVFLFKTETVFSNNLIYDVNNIEVSGKINNDLDQKKLIEEAFKKAFIIFINKTLLSEDVKVLHKTKIEVIQDLIFTYQIVNNERNKKKINTLTINIKFNPNKINSFLAQRKISYADISNISLTLLPILIKDDDLHIYSNNYFYKNWNKKEKEKNFINQNLITYNLSLENIEDLQYININKKNLDLIDVKKITSFNNEKNYVFLIIYLSEGKFRAYIKTFINNNRIDKNINLRIYPDATTKSYEEAIVLIKKKINQIWKEQNLVDINTPSFLDFFLEIEKINDYVKLKSVLDSIDIIEKHDVLEITNKYVKIRIKYKGKIAKVKNKLLKQKINFQITDNVWRLKIN